MQADGEVAAVVDGPDLAVEITDLDVLAEACRRLGLELVRGQRTYRWSGIHEAVPLPPDLVAPGYQLGQCDHAIRVLGNPDAFEVGLVPATDGRGYAVTWDFWRDGFGLMAAVGRDCERLLSEYAAVARSRRRPQTE